MPVVQIEAQLSTEELLEAADQLDETELEQFALQIIALRARRQAPSLPKAEAALLIEINRGLRPEEQERYDELIGKRRRESLTPDEYEELLCLTDHVESVAARRMKALAELARLRGITMTALMEDLGIQTPSDV
jgi:hypothetical protein